MRLFTFSLVVLLVTLVFRTTSSENNVAADELSPKVRNVDDPGKDPVQYSRQWMDILARLESIVSGSWQFGARWRAVADKFGGGGNISEQCSAALSVYFERPLEQQWSFQSECSSFVLFRKFREF